jgi:hypothetical protein
MHEASQTAKNLRNSINYYLFPLNKGMSFSIGNRLLFQIEHLTDGLRQLILRGENLSGCNFLQNKTH